MTASAYTNVSVLKNWMAGMGKAATTGVDVMYCCAEPNVHMNGVTVPSAYAVRSSPDYVGNGPTCAFRLSVGDWAGCGVPLEWSWATAYKDTLYQIHITQKSGRSWAKS